MLRHPGIETRLQRRAECTELRVGRLTGIVEPDRQVRARLKALVIQEIRCAGVLEQNRHVARKWIRRFLRELVDLQGTCQDWIVGSDRGSEAERRTHDSK